MYPLRTRIRIRIRVKNKDKEKDLVIRPLYAPYIPLKIKTKKKRRIRTRLKTKTDKNNFSLLQKNQELYYIFGPAHTT